MTATGPLSGQTLKVTFKPQGGEETFIGGVDGWNFGNTIDSKDVTSALTGNDAAWKKYLPTLRDAKGAITLKFMDLTDTGQYALWEAFNESGLDAVGEFKFYQDSTHYLFADGFVSSFPLSARLDGIQGEGITIDIQLYDDDGLQLGGYS
jgi:hypothetical protein